MKFALLAGAILAALVEHVQSKAVFAHFMLANSENFTDATWQNNYKLAAEASINGFALNIGHSDPRYETLIASAFRNAAISKFPVFLNFDYAAGGVWPIENIVLLIKQYRDHQYYYKYQSKPLVATFEGYDRASDWPTIKAQAGSIFFMPQWSSVPPYAQISIAGIDGLTSWDAWPAGNNKMYSQNDATYMGALKTVNKPYMMPVSPWFFTRMPNYDKNWAWKGDSLWYDRWTQVLHKQPEFVQIISWNDFGESHYIGPLDEGQYAAFDSNHGNSPYNYARGMPHDAWRKHLPYLIAMYKNRATTINQERTVAWFRTTSLTNAACNPGGTTGNAPAKFQATYGVSQIMEDKVFFSVLLGSAATVTVTIGGISVPVTWLTVPRSGVGLHHGSAPFNGLTGQVLVTVSRTNPDRIVMQVLGASITAACPQGIHNYNAWVGSKDSGITTLGRASTAITHCNAGTGWSTYALLCGYSCQFDYCPDVCTCTLLGSQIANPPATKTRGCPVSSLDSTYQGLCDHTCARTTCVSGVCNQLSTADSNNYNNVCKPKAPVTPAPYVCRAGKGYFSGGTVFDSLCAAACRFNQCKSEICICTEAGPASIAYPVPAVITTQTYQEITGWYNDQGLCNWLCQRGQCPTDRCISTAAAGNRRIAPTTPKVLPEPRRIFQGLVTSIELFYTGNEAGRPFAQDAQVTSIVIVSIFYMSLAKFHQ